MAQQISIKSNKEYFIFETLAGQPNFKAVYNALKEYDTEHPQNKILPEKKGKEAAQYMYDVFKEAERALTTKEIKPNYADSAVMEQMLKAVSDSIYKRCSCPLKDVIKGNIGASVNKFNIGRVLLQFADNIANKRGVIVQNKRHTPLAETNRYGHVDFGHINDRPSITFKTNAQKIRERICNEK
ncbi:MAG: hypothetical protein IKR92_03330 [Alphaproteobacteria bacterium]|nr:hypothetical protein [Alphaproteobacteria bacterium]